MGELNDETTEDLIEEYKKIILTREETLKNQSLPPEIISETQEDLNTLYNLLEGKEKLKEQHQRQITSIKDAILNKELESIGLKLAQLSDSTKDKNISEKKRDEIMQELKKLENTKELLTQKLSYFNPTIAAQFRTSTPVEPMETEEELRRKRNASTSEFNRSKKKKKK